MASLVTIPSGVVAHQRLLLNGPRRCSRDRGNSWLQGGAWNMLPTELSTSLSGTDVLTYVSNIVQHCYNSLFLYVGTIFCLQSIIELRTGSTQEDLCNGFHVTQSSNVWLSQLHQNGMIRLVTKLTHPKSDLNSKSKFCLSQAFPPDLET